MGLKEIILHAGIHKTGTTSIQDTLYSNRELLAKHKVLYPACFGQANHGIPLFNLFAANAFDRIDTFVHFHNLSYGLQRPDLVAARNHKNEEALMREVEESGCERLILSGEDVSLLLSADIQRIKPYFTGKFGCGNIRVIVYVRDIVPYAVSLYQQYLIWHAIDDIPADYYVRKNLGGVFRSKICAFWEAFGKESVTVIPFEQAVKSPEGLVKNLMREAGIPQQVINSSAILRNNQSRCLEVNELIAYINMRQPRYRGVADGTVLTENPNRIGGDLHHLLAIPGVKFDLPFEKKEELFNVALPDILWLKENVGIDYTESLDKTAKSSPRAAYAAETLDALLVAFPKLSIPLQDLFLDYFQELYQQTGDKKFAALCERENMLDHIFQLAANFERYMTRSSKQAAELGIVYYPAINDNHLQIFTSSGPDGFCEENSHKFDFGQLTEIFHIRLEFSRSENITQFRLDPSVYPCVVLMQSLKVNENTEGYDISGGNCSGCFEDVYSFFTSDPQIVFHSGEVITSIEMKIMVVPADFVYSFCLQQVFGEMRARQMHLAQDNTNLGQRNANLKKQNANLKEHNVNLEQHSADLEKQLNDCKNSLSWKITKPLRGIRRLVQQIINR